MMLLTFFHAATVSLLRVIITLHRWLFSLLRALDAILMMLSPLSCLFCSYFFMPRYIRYAVTPIIYAAMRANILRRFDYFIYDYADYYTEVFRLRRHAMPSLSPYFSPLSPHFIRRFLAIICRRSPRRYSFSHAATATTSGRRSVSLHIRHTPVNALRLLILPLIFLFIFAIASAFADDFRRFFSLFIF